MPRIWHETIEAHRDAVREAAINATAALLAEHGRSGVTMSQIAKDTGIGRATLYKYFPDVESILSAWHDRQVGRHLRDLRQVRDRAEPGFPRLAAVLTAYARAIAHRRDHDNDMADLLHRGEHTAAAHRHLGEFVRELIAHAATTGAVRGDVPADELTAYCLHALAAAATLRDPAAVDRLVRTTLAGMQARGAGQRRTDRAAR